MSMENKSGQSPKDDRPAVKAESHSSHGYNQVLSLVQSSIQLVRKGSFIAVFKDTGRLETLTSLAQSTSSDWVGVVSRAILAETYDQVGLYKKAEEWATYDVGRQSLRVLQEEIEAGIADRNTARARAMLILQCAVSRFRRESGHTEALQLLNQAIDLITKNEGEALRSLHVRSLFYFWRGRIHTLQYEFEEAESDFQYALDVVDRNLEWKLRNVDQLDEAKRNEQVAAGNYALATCLGFGFGQLRQLEGKLVESLRFLKVAVPLSRGSVDFHRRGFAHLLTGIALRSRGWEDGQNNDLDAAESHLLEARD